MSNKKVKKNIWERTFSYPSFNIRFGYTLGTILTIFILFSCFLIFKTTIAVEPSEVVSLLNLIIQSATLVLGIFATYYALRQLVETRFTGLDQAGMQELKQTHYSRAFEKWREAFYIKPDPKVFNDMCEVLLLMQDYNTFDEYVEKSFLKKDIFQESSDKIIILYLKSVRHLLVKNQGEAEKSIEKLVKLVKEKTLLGFSWDFIDIQISPMYQDLSGDCKKIMDNLISYLSKTIQTSRKIDFESGNFSSDVD